MVAAFILAGVPVYRLTRPASAEAAVSASVADPLANAAAAKPAPLEVDALFAPAPADFQIKNLDQTVLAGGGPPSHYHTRWTATVPPEGVDLVIQARWSENATAEARPAAARVTVRFPDGQQVEKSFWADPNGSLTDVFTVPGVPGTAAP